MAASQEQKVDYLLKKIGYSISKTGIAEESSLSGTKKSPFGESIPSPLIISSNSIWADSSLIPATPPSSNTSYVGIYTAGTSGFRMTVDNTISGNRTFIARSSWGNNSSSNIGDWIDPQFGSDYSIKVYKGNPSAGGVQLSASGSGTNDTWFFDYSSGVLNFNGDVVPVGITSDNVYIVGYRYIGAKGARPTAGLATFTSLNVTGVSTFNNTVIISSSVLGIGTSSPSTTLDVVGNVKISGIITATDFDSLSDLNYKENIVTINTALINLEKIRGVKFDWKESKKPSYGVIAQELESVFPELVRGNDPKTVNYNGLIGILIEAIKELRLEVEDLKDKINNFNRFDDK